MKKLISCAKTVYRFLRKMNVPFASNWMPLFCDSEFYFDIDSDITKWMCCRFEGMRFDDQMGERLKSIFFSYGLVSDYVIKITSGGKKYYKFQFDLTSPFFLMKGYVLSDGLRCENNGSWIKPCTQLYQSFFDNTTKINPYMIDYRLRQVYFGKYRSENIFSYCPFCGKGISTYNGGVVNEKTDGINDNLNGSVINFMR